MAKTAPTKLTLATTALVSSLYFSLLYLFAKSARPGDSKGTLRFSSQAATCHLSTT